MILAGVLLKLGGCGLIRVFPLLFKFGFVFRFIWISLSLVGGAFVGCMVNRNYEYSSTLIYFRKGNYI